MDEVHSPFPKSHNNAVEDPEREAEEIQSKGTTEEEIELAPD